MFFLAVFLVGLLSFLYTRRKKMDFAFMLQMVFLVGIFVALFAWKIPSMLNENFSSFAGIFVGVVVALSYLKLRKKGYEYLDVIALFLPLGFAIGRLGCFFHWCCGGIATGLPWGVVVNESIVAHPTQIYSIIMNLIIFGIFFYFKNNKFFSKNPGNLTLSVFASYSFFRLILIEPLRMGVGESTRSIFLAVIFSIALLVLYFRNRKG